MQEMWTSRAVSEHCLKIDLCLSGAKSYAISLIFVKSYSHWSCRAVSRVYFTSALVVQKRVASALVKAGHYDRPARFTPESGHQSEGVECNSCQKLHFALDVFGFKLFGSVVPIACVRSR